MEEKELTLKEIQQVSLDICKKIDEICDEQNLRYYLYGGSLLGAVRHKGFIPWDDDIDIVMPRNDYCQLIEYIKKNEDKLKPLKLFHIDINPKYPYMISRVSNDDYYLKVKNEKPYGMGIFIDIYPWDGIGNSEAEIVKRKGIAARYSSLCYLSTRKKCIRENTKSKIKLLVKPAAFLFAKAVGKDFFVKKLNALAGKYLYDDANYVGCLVWGTDGVKGIFPRDWMEPYVKLPFEDAFFRAPKEYHKALQKLYHHYMELPPEKDRMPHHYYRAYRKNKKGY